MSVVRDSEYTFEKKTFSLWVNFLLKLSTHFEELTPTIFVSIKVHIYFSSRNKQMCSVHILYYHKKTPVENRMPSESRTYLTICFMTNGLLGHLTRPFKRIKMSINNDQYSLFFSKNMCTILSGKVVYYHVINK